MAIQRSPLLRRFASTHFLVRALNSVIFSGFTLTMKTSRYSPCAWTATGVAKHTTTAKAQRAFRNDMRTSFFGWELTGRNLGRGLYSCEAVRSSGDKKIAVSLSIDKRAQFSETLAKSFGSTILSRAISSNEVQRGFQRNASEQHSGQKFVASHYHRLARHCQRRCSAVYLALRHAVFSSLQRAAIRLLLAAPLSPCHPHQRRGARAHLWDAATLDRFAPARDELPSLDRPRLSRSRSGWHHRCVLDGCLFDAARVRRRAYEPRHGVDRHDWHRVDCDSPRSRGNAQRMDDALVHRRVCVCHVPHRHGFASQRQQAPRLQCGRCRNERGLAQLG